MTIKEWVYNLEIRGSYTFSVEDAMSANPKYSAAIIHNELYRLCKQKRIMSVYRGFYAIIPAHYALRGEVPPEYYIDHLMAYLRKPYYVSLLSAGDLHGAAHQRPQRYFVTTVKPAPRMSAARTATLHWTYKESLPEHLLQKRNSETGAITFSCPELTAVDLVRYEQHIGGLSRAAEVLAELCEKTDFSTAAATLFPYTTMPTIQRLGYILEHVLEETQQAETLYEQLRIYGHPYQSIPLFVRGTHDYGTRDDRWRVIVNGKLDLDEI